MSERRGDQLEAGDVVHFAGTDWTVNGTLTGTVATAANGELHVTLAPDQTYDVTPVNEKAPTPLNETEVVAPPEEP